MHYLRKSCTIKRILILSANPKDTIRIRFDQEAREIKERMRLSRYRDQFSVETALAMRVNDLQQILTDQEPQIVHFCGHGETDGLLFETETGVAQLVHEKALSGLFKLFAQSVECVILNACYSQQQAIAIHQHIPCVIGMSNKIGDEAAIKFSSGFYTGLGSGRSYAEAFEFGCNAINLENIPEHLTPVLLKKSSHSVIQQSKIESPSFTPPQTQSRLTAAQQQRLQQKLDELKKLNAIITQKINAINETYLLETNPSVKLQRKHELENSEAERTAIEEKMDEILSQLEI